MIARTHGAKGEQVPSKYRAVPTVVDGIRFASKKEAAHYGTLKILERAGKITELRIQPKWELVIFGQKICTYIADFYYLESVNGKLFGRIEDVKGIKTPVYRLKKKLMKAIHNIEITEV